MLCFPNAKINIGLQITNKRGDGFHDLETIFFPIPMADALEILPASLAPGIESIQVSGIPVPGAIQGNLILKAFQLLKIDFPNQIGDLAIFLHKCIPMGGGLGGGSSDAAFMLRMLNDYFDLKLTEEKLMRYALELGSDCPFFIINKPCFAKGRGEILERISLDLSAYGIQIICPEIHVSTAMAFRNISPQKPGFNLSGIGNLLIEDWKDHIKNDFEEGIFKMYPQLSTIKMQLYNQGALYAGMSGTGSSIYGIFPQGEKARIQLETKFKAYYFNLGSEAEKFNIKK